MRTLGLLAATSLLSTIGSVTDDEGAPPLTVFDASSEQTDQLDSAVQLFVDAQLALPNLSVHFSGDPAPCHGHLGTFATRTVPWTITICSDLAFVPIHELAHAWLEANIDAATRRSYLEARHTTNWNDKRTNWSERGVEDAAFIIQQNLMITPPTPLTPEWQRRAEAYELLTGRPSPVRAAHHLDAATSITITSTSPTWTERIQWALAPFRAANLPLPPMTVTVHTSGCDGNSGLYRQTRCRSTSAPRAVLTPVRLA